MFLPAGYKTTRQEKFAKFIREIVMEESKQNKDHGTSLVTQRLAGAHIDSVAEQIYENDQYVCMGGDVFGPFHFYVTLKQNWNMLEHAQITMQNYYVEGERRPTQLFVSERHLLPGDFVAYNFEKEWHRGKIMDIKNDGSECEVKLIDYGASYLEPVKMLKVLHRDQYTLLAQAIRCQLDLTTEDARLLQQLDVDRKKLVQKSFRDILRDRDLLVIFKEMSFEGQGSLKEIKWKVDLYIVENSEKDDLIVHVKEGGTVQKQLLRNLRVANVIPPLM